MRFTMTKVILGFEVNQQGKISVHYSG